MHEHGKARNALNKVRRALSMLLWGFSRRCRYLNYTAPNSKKTHESSSGKGLEGSGSDLTSALPRHLPEGQRKAKETSARIVGVSAKTRTEYIPNTSLENLNVLHRYRNGPHMRVLAYEMFQEHLY